MSSFEYGFQVPNDMEREPETVLLPMSFDNKDLRLKHIKYGNAVFYQIMSGKDGCVGITYKLDDTSPYNNVMEQLVTLVDIAPEKAQMHQEALIALMTGCFDDSEFGAYVNK